MGSASTRWQGVRVRVASTAWNVHLLLSLNNANFPMWTDHGKYGLWTIEVRQGRGNVYTVGDFGGHTISGYCGGYDCDYEGRAVYWGVGDTIGIMFKKVGTDLLIRYEKNGVAFRELNTATLVSSTKPAGYPDNIFPLRIDT